VRDQIAGADAAVGLDAVADGVGHEGAPGAKRKAEKPKRRRSAAALQTRGRESRETKAASIAALLRKQKAGNGRMSKDRPIPPRKERRTKVNPLRGAGLQSVAPLPVCGCRRPRPQPQVVAQTPTAEALPGDVAERDTLLHVLLAAGGQQFRVRSDIRTRLQNGLTGTSVRRPPSRQAHRHHSTRPRFHHSGCRPAP
jgi:hypothetical protein